ncbi:hypothetical protein KKA15_00520 [Patescibacteria group bacterium]|nr:hypothetical protein [Patescibacteria group bacterium]
MPRFFHLTRKKQKVTKKKSKNFRISQISFKTFSFLVYGGLVILFLAYLVQINSIATKGYIISDLESQLSTLAKENNGLQEQVLSLQGTDNVEDKLEGMGLVNSEAVEYIKISKPAVALR